MKKNLALGLLITLLAGSCTQETVSPMQGAWKLTYEYEVTDGRSILICNVHAIHHQVVRF